MNFVEAMDGGRGKSRAGAALAWLLFRVLAAAGLGLICLQLLYEAVARHRAQGPDLAMVLVVVPAASYLWWLMGWLLRLMGVRGGPALSLLVSLALTIWILVGSMQFGLGEHLMGASEGLWTWVELAAGVLLRWLRL